MTELGKEISYIDFLYTGMNSRNSGSCFAEYIFLANYTRVPKYLSINTFEEYI